ncbi:isochorismate synthase MenF [Altericista sp. CCNU0014]|uniref:isochorismate synthase n=1 Tax=Altericista sp. CCNU0014 TaxID=3082949 RepID=UPI003850A8E6
MTVTPFRVPLMQDPKALYECLATFQASSSNDEAIASISLALPPLDPLAALEQLGHATQAHFYWEHPTEKTAIAAMQPIARQSIDGGDRFAKTQRFISEVLQRTATAGELHLPMAGPHFFCSFTFFDKAHHEAQRFPAATVFLPQWQVACVRGQGVLVANLPLTPTANLAQLTDSVLQIWQRLQCRSAIYRDRFSLPLLHVPEPCLSHQTRFLEAAEATLTQIRKGELEKLVLSETLEVKTATPLPLAPTLHKLRSRYGDCQIFSLRDDRGQGFIGASPERLLQIQEGRLTADALAGSAPRGRTLREDAALGDRLLKSAKDIHEHRLVLAFIQQRLQSLGIAPHSTSPAHLLQLPNIQHLRTLVTADLPDRIGLLNVLAALHPTPAVAGTPQHSAEPYLRRYEPFDRHLYAAPLGWVDYRGNGSFTVGIRSALLQGNCLRLYAGAGIVAGSDPHREWAEVRLKLQTLLQALVEYKM